MKLSIPAGTTSKRIAIFIQDSSSTTGAGLTGLAFGSAGLTCYSWIDTAGNAGGVAQALQTATLGTWTTRGFIEKDATNMPGFYEFGIPDALLAAGVKWVVILFKGGTNMAPLPIEIEVTAVSNQDAVRGGMTALPNANAEAAGGLYTRGSGAGQINQSTNGQVDVDAKKWNALTTVALPLVPSVAGRSLVVDAAGLADANVVKLGPTGTGTAQTARDIGASVLLSAGTGTGQLDFTSGVVKANLAQILGTALTETVGQIAAAFKKWFDVAAPVGTVNSIPNATAGAAGGIAIVGSNMGTVSSVTGAVGSVTGNVGGNVTGSVGSVVGAVGSVTGNVGGNVVGSVASVSGNVGGNVVGSVGSLTTNNDKTGYALTSGERTSVADALLDRDMSLGADTGSTTVRTVRQALRFLRNKWSISAGTLTVTKENDATASWTGAVTTTAGNPVTTIDPA